MAGEDPLLACSSLFFGRRKKGCLSRDGFLLLKVRWAESMAEIPCRGCQGCRWGFRYSPDQAKSLYDMAKMPRSGDEH